MNNGNKLTQSEILACVLFLTFAVAVHADQTASNGKNKPVINAPDMARTRRDVQAVYNRQTAALLRKDVRGFLALCTRDYKDVARNGQIYDADRLRQVLPGQIAQYPRSFQMKSVIQSFRLQGNRADVTANRHLELMRTDKLHHKLVKWKSDTVTRDVWLKTPEGWKTQHSKEVLFNGQKPVSPPKRKPRGRNSVTGKTAEPPKR